MLEAIHQFDPCLRSLLQTQWVIAQEVEPRSFSKGIEIHGHQMGVRLLCMRERVEASV